MADRVQELLTAAEAQLDAIETLGAKADAAETDEETETLTGELEAAQAEFDQITTKLEGAKSERDRKARYERLRDGLDVEEPEGTGETAEGAKGAKGEDPTGIRVSQSEDRQHKRMFIDYLGGKDIRAYSTNERNFLHPKSDGFKEGASGIRFPDSYRTLFLGRRAAKSFALYGGKAITSDDADTGAPLVDEDYLAELLELPPEPGHLLGRVTVIPVVGGEIKIPRLVQTDSNEYGGMIFTWPNAEAEAKGETEPELEQVSIDTHEVNGYTEISETQLTRNAIATNNIVTTLYRDGLRGELDTQIISGSGTGEPQGITNATSVREVNRETAGDGTAKDVIGLKHAVLPHHRQDALFIVHDDFEEQIELDDLARENPTIDNGQMKGFPYEVTVRQPALGSDGDALFGDATAYYLGMEKEIVVSRSSDFQFRKNVVAFKVWALVGGQLVLPRAMAMLTASTS